MCEGPADGGDGNGNGNGAASSDDEDDKDALMRLAVALEAEEVKDEWKPKGVDPSDVDCEDEEGGRDCARRARAGHCATHPVHMLTNCRRSCRDCRVIHVAAPADVRSYDQVVYVEGPRPHVLFRNERAASVRVHWVNSDSGRPTAEPNAVVPPGRTGRIGTYYGHTFVGFDAESGEEVGRYTVAKDSPDGHKQRHTFT